jgi:hypothetical protein
MKLRICLDLAEKKNNSKISLELVGSLNSSLENWVWIIIGDNILCSIKYENSLIFINRYDKSHGIEIACKHCFQTQITLSTMNIQLIDF